MAESIIALQKSGSAVFNASGVATYILRNGGLTTWRVKNTSISTTSTSRSQCTVYRGDASGGNQLDITKKGNADSSDTTYDINIGEFVTLQWTLGTPGSIATFRVEGDEIIKGKRIY